MGELLVAIVTLVVPSVTPCEVLAALDVVRSAAWESGDRVRLAHLYAEGAGDEDLARLRAWRDRGVRVEGMRTVRASCEPVDASSIEVVERLGPTVAVLPDGARRSLPQDAWDRRIVTVERIDGSWRITAVRSAG